MSETKHSPLPSSFEETIDFVYEVQNMADATERAVVLWPAISLHHDLVAALEAAVKMNRSFEESSKNQAAAYYAFVDRKHAVWYDIEAVLAKAKQPNLEEPRR